MKYLEQFAPPTEPRGSHRRYQRTGAYPRLRLAILLVIAGLGVAQAETLPLPSGLIALDSEQGQRLFFATEANKAYFLSIGAEL